MQAIEQGNRTIDKYGEEFHHLIDMNDVSEIEDQLVTHYIHVILLYWFEAFQNCLCTH